MQRKKRLSKEFISKLAELAGGAIQSGQFDNLISLIENEIKLHFFTDSSEANLIRIIENQFDRVFFIKECINYPHQIEILVTIASNSNYLSDILVRNPEYIFTITNPENLKKQRKESDFTKIVLDSVNRFKTFNGKVTALRNLKRREFLRIGLMDVYLNEKVKRITREISFLTKSITSILFDLCFKEILQKYKIEKLSNKYCLIALGKLGGNELNYSSDIDLIVFTDKNTFINKRIYYNQIITETVQLFIEQASSISSKGFLYRVDFRLRPDGKNAPLCGTINQYLRYYELRGEDWERQMLIKAGFICGSYNLYKKFCSYLEKFIYPSSFSVSPLVQIKKLKSNIEKRVSEADNIKLIPGGIRDIEFSVQALQLLNGGKNKSLRTGNTLSAINELNKSKLLSDAETKTFSEAYIIYRKIEHYLQLMNNTQTHTIPDSGELLEKVSHHLGFNTSSEFRKTLEATRKNVSAIYQSITGIDEIKSESIFENIKFIDEKRAQQNLDFLKYGKGILGSKIFDKITTSLFENIQDDLADYLKKSVLPDIVLENFSRIIKSAQFPNIWYKEFADKNFLKLFLGLCEFSQFAINLCAEDKSLRDLLLSRKCFTQLEESELSQLSTKEILFILSVQLTSGLIKSNETSQVLASFINKKINICFRSFTSDKEWKNNIIVIGMGSLGAGEITFASDIDLIFVIDGINKYQRVQNDFQEFLSIIRKELSPFDVDCRLRPEGKGGHLVWDLKSYSDYLKNRARIWEFQAFLKADLIFGSKKYFNTLIEDCVKSIQGFEQNIIKKEMFEMRRKSISSDSISGSTNIKRCSGGLTDIEYIISYFLLSDFRLVKNFIGVGKEKFAKVLSLDKDKDVDFELLAQNFNKLKEIELVNQNLFDSRTPRIPVDEIKLKSLSVSLGFKSSELFLDDLNRMLQTNTKIFKQVFG